MERFNIINITYSNIYGCKYSKKERERKAKSAVLYYLLQPQWRGTQSFINSAMADVGKGGAKKIESDLTPTNKPLACSSTL